MEIINKKDISGIINFKDDVEDFISGDRGEWLQYLSENLMANNERIILLGIHHEEELKGYMVLIDGRQRPISDCLYILYVWSELSPKDNLEAWRLFIEFVKENDLPRVVKAAAKHPNLMAKFGFSEDLDLVPIKLTIKD